VQEDRRLSVDVALILFDHQEPARARGFERVRGHFALLRVSNARRHRTWYDQREFAKLTAPHLTPARLKLAVVFATAQERIAPREQRVNHPLSATNVVIESDR
jgi:hypothetical protein